MAKSHVEDLKAKRQRFERRAGVRHHVTPEQKAKAQLSPAQRGYDAAYRRERRKYLRAHPFCEDCMEEGVLVPSAEVDHQLAIRKGGDRLDHANFRALCKPCHSRKTVLVDGGFGRPPVRAVEPGPGQGEGQGEAQ